MTYEEAKYKFIQAWGVLGAHWGINRVMAQIHALLMISPEALTADEIMSELSISRGNVSMNLRSLMEWGIINKEYRPGERKEYFLSEKDVWSLARQVAKERRKREIEPLLKVLSEVNSLNDSRGVPSKKISEFRQMVKSLDQFATKSDKVLEYFIKSGDIQFLNKLLKWMG